MTYEITKIRYCSTKEMNEPYFAVTASGETFNIHSFIEDHTEEVRCVTLWVWELFDFLYAQGRTDVEMNTHFFLDVLQRIRVLLQTRFACRITIETVKVYLGAVPLSDRNRPVVVQIPGKILFYSAGSIEPSWINELSSEEAKHPNYRAPERPHREPAPMRTSLARRGFEKIDRAFDADASPARRIATPVLFFAFLLFLAFVVRALLGWTN